MVALKSLTVARRLALLTLACVAGIVTLAIAVLISERSLIMAERQAGVQQVVEGAQSMLAGIHAQVKAGNISEQAGRQQALLAIKSMRYGAGEYLWVNDMHPTMVMHPIKPELDGKDLTENRDPTGKQLFVEFVQTVRSAGAGFVWYMWPKPGSDKAVQKVSYVKAFEPWGWVVGSGVYVDTVDSTIASRALYAMGWALLLAVALAAISLLISRSVIHQLGGEPDEATRITRAMAQGDLAVSITLSGGDRSSLLHEIRTMRDSLAAIVGQVRSGSQTVASASVQIEMGDRDLATRTEQQASTLEETAASMEQLGSMVKKNAQNAQAASQLALSASTVAVQGGVVVGQVVDTMKGISDSSRRIVDIIGVIDGIAFQTNILALNAAVEAARAGEQGRGFAVVASEVRSLAGRSASAAKEIKALIGTSVQKMEAGSVLVDQAGQTMQEIVESSKRVADLMAQISQASLEQATGVAEVGEAVATMDQATQQNAALVEEIAASAGHLKAQAQTLVELVESFRLVE